MCRVNKKLSAVFAILGLLAVAAASTPAVAAAASESEVQGLYEGTGTDAAGEFQIEARVVAQGNGQYKVFVRQIRAGGNVARAELAGSTAEGAVAVAGKSGDVAWTGLYGDGTLRGQCTPGGKFELRRVEKKSPTLGKKPPAGAVVLLDGKDFSGLVLHNGADLRVSPEKIDADGSIQIPPGGMNTRRTFPGSFDLHVEFRIPLMPAAHSQGRGNSGVFLPNKDEIQVLDSFGDTTYLGGGCGGIYPYKDPDPMEVIDSLRDKPECKFSLASLPPMAWQTYDIEYRVATKDGKPVGKPRVTVCHNGVKIHKDVELRSPPNVPEAPLGKLHFQDHGNPVRYRNIWVAPK